MRSGVRRVVVGLGRRRLGTIPIREGNAVTRSAVLVVAIAHSVVSE